VDGEAELQVSLGFASLTGRRQRNEDFVGAYVGSSAQRAQYGVVAALADGMGGAKGGREAAEVAVRGFLDGYFDQTATLGVRRAASHVLSCLNAWLVTQGRQDPNLAGMGATFTALILRGRTAHVMHVGDSRLYRLSEGRLTRLTEDHALKQAGLTHVLYRALGIEETVRFDYAAHPVVLHDRFMVSSDGIHGVLSDDRIADILGRQSGPQETAQALAAAALEAGSDDNATAMVVDVVGLPAADRDGIGQCIDNLEIRPMPQVGDSIDGFRLLGVVSDGRYSRLFRARRPEDQADVVLKFPHPTVASEATYRAAFMREAWVSAQVRSPFVAQALPLDPGQQTVLYTVMPLYQGETLERRLSGAKPIGFAEGRDIAIGLSKAVVSLHRMGLIHRDIKPDNVLLEEGGGLRLLDLGVVRVPGMEDFAEADIPGTPSFMAPEMFQGERGNELTDVYALAATVFRMFTAHYPQGEIEAFSRPKFTKTPSLAKLRPDLPAWLDGLLARALAPDPAKRPQDALEFLLELESGPVAGPSLSQRRQSFYDRDPVMFWKMVSLALLVALVLSQAHR
jgi:serine/threonine protein phosphatase PrpC